MSTRRRFHILFDDEHLVVVEKGPGVLTVPTTRHETNTLVQMLRQYLGGGRRFAPRLEVVHRLDREVSGVLVFAKSATVAERLREAFAAHRPEREYVALVAGTLDVDAGTFTSRLLTGKSLQRFSSDDGERGEEATTHYQVERRLAGATLVRVRLETGRRNQIRVHFAEAGHPILGEQRYRPEQARHRLWRAARLALHARLLAFAHPATGEALRFESPLPPEFMSFQRAADLAARPVERGRDDARPRQTARPAGAPRQDGRPRHSSRRGPAR